MDADVKQHKASTHVVSESTSQLPFKKLPPWHSVKELPHFSGEAVKSPLFSNYVSDNTGSALYTATKTSYQHRFNPGVASCLPLGHTLDFQKRKVTPTLVSKNCLAGKLYLFFY